MKISYYELLKLTRQGEYPIIEYNNIKYIPDFDIVDGSFLDYQIDKKSFKDDVKFYLAENFLECEMFNRVLKIVDQDKLKGAIRTLQGSPNSIRKSIGLPLKEEKKIEPINENLDYLEDIPFSATLSKRFTHNELVIINKLNELIEKVNGE